jgi:hypothetical protein
MLFDVKLRSVGQPLNVVTQKFADPLPVRDCRSRQWRIVRSPDCKYADSLYHSVHRTWRHSQCQWNSKRHSLLAASVGNPNDMNLSAGSSTLHTDRLLRSKTHSRHIYCPLRTNKDLLLNWLQTLSSIFMWRTSGAHCYNNAIMATLFIATWHRDGVEGFPVFINGNHIHIETHLTPGWNKICCFETSADSARLHGAKSRKQEYEITSPRKPKIVHTVSTVGCNIAVPLWFRVCCDTPYLSLPLWAGHKAAAYNLQYSCKYWLSWATFIKWAFHLISHNIFMAAGIRPERREGKSGRRTGLFAEVTAVAESGN